MTYWDCLVYISFLFLPTWGSIQFSQMERMGPEESFRTCQQQDWPKMALGRRDTVGVASSAALCGLPRQSLRILRNSESSHVHTWEPALGRPILCPLNLPHHAFIISLTERFHVVLQKSYLSFGWNFAATLSAGLSLFSRASILSALGQWSLRSQHQPWTRLQGQVPALRLSWLLLCPSDEQINLRCENCVLLISRLRVQSKHGCLIRLLLTLIDSWRILFTYSTDSYCMCQDEQDSAIPALSTVTFKMLYWVFICQALY